MKKLKVKFLNSFRNYFSKNFRKVIKVKQKHWFGFDKSKGVYFKCNEIEWDEHRYMNLKKNFTKFVHSDYCFNNRIDEEKLKVMKTKIHRM